MNKASFILNFGLLLGVISLFLLPLGLYQATVGAPNAYVEARGGPVPQPILLLASVFGELAAFVLLGIAVFLTRRRRKFRAKAPSL